MTTQKKYVIIDLSNEREVIKMIMTMTGLEKILLACVLYLAMGHAWNFISVMFFDGILADEEDLLCNLLWGITIPVALVIRAVKEIKRFFKKMAGA